MNGKLCVCVCVSVLHDADDEDDEPRASSSSEFTPKQALVCVYSPAHTGTNLARAVLGLDGMRGVGGGVKTECSLASCLTSSLTSSLQDTSPSACRPFARVQSLK